MIDGFPMSKVAKARVSDRVLEALVELLRSGALKQGDKLPNEIALARSLGVARSSLREAVRSLIVAGVLDAAPGRGTVVAAPFGQRFSDELALTLAHAAVRDFYDLRMLLEGEAVARAALNWTPSQLRDIEQANSVVNRLIRQGRSWFAANGRFHGAIARASGNSAFYFCIRSILNNFREMREMLDLLPSTPIEDIEDHQAI